MLNYHPHTSLTYFATAVRKVNKKKKDTKNGGNPPKKNGKIQQSVTISCSLQGDKQNKARPQAKLEPSTRTAPCLDVMGSGMPCDGTI